MRWGVFHSGLPGDSPGPLDSFTALIGGTPDVFVIYRSFGGPLLYPAEMPNLRRVGATPLVTWEPYDQSLASIASGEHDDVIDSAAGAVNAFGSVVLVRFAHEMNGRWYPWCEQPDDYVAAWRHLVRRMRNRTKLARFVWCPNSIGSHSPEVAPYWPGSETVNWLSFDSYNWGEDEWESPYEVYRPTYEAVSKLATTKPVVIAETAAAEHGGSKARWISNLPRALSRLPKVTTLCWFDKDQRPLGKPDWRIDSSPASLAAFRKFVGGL